MNSLIVITLILFVGGCAATSTQHRPESYYANGAAVEDDSDLFGSGELLSDSEIERILSYRLKLPAKNRLAILKLSEDSYWRNYSNDFTQLTDSISQNFIEALIRSDQIYDASFLPSMRVYCLK